MEYYQSEQLTPASVPRVPPGIGHAGMADCTVWLTLVSNLSRGPADTVYPKAPTINLMVNITTGPKALR